MDTATLHAAQTTFSAAGLQFARATTNLQVGPSGASTAVLLDWPNQPETHAPVIGGFSIVAAGDASACYNPAFGWLPRRIGLAVEADGTDARVSAHFVAGASLEEERACLDDAVPEATIALSVTILALAGIDTTTTSVEKTAAYELGTTSNPDPQEAPVSTLTPDGLAWQSLDWSFHVTDADSRGAYLRSLAFDAGEQSSASASNYSPGTQLSGFDYAFVGTVLGAPGERERVDSSASYAPVLDANGTASPVVLQ